MSRGTSVERGRGGGGGGGGGRSSLAFSKRRAAPTAGLPSKTYYSVKMTNKRAQRANRVMNPPGVKSLSARPGAALAAQRRGGSNRGRQATNNGYVARALRTFSGCNPCPRRQLASMDDGLLRLVCFIDALIHSLRCFTFLDTQCSLID